jgi:hypothetical protein
MSSAAVCPSCRERFDAGTVRRGSVVRCPACGDPVPAPESADLEAEVLATRTAPVPRQRSRLWVYVRRAGAALVLGFVFLIVVGTVLESQWEPFEPPGGRCRVMMPGDADDIMEEVREPGRPGDPVGHSYQLQRAFPPEVYVVTFVDLPPGAGAAERLLDEACETALRELPNARQVNRTPVGLAEYPGREMVLDLGGTEAVMICRFYLVGDRMYELLVGGPGVKPGAKDANRFFDSFELTEAPPLPVAPAVRAKGRKRW